jgi:mono/diheme cytochrome c family protein
MKMTLQTATVLCLVAVMGLAGCKEARQLEFGIPAGKEPAAELNSLYYDMYDSHAIEAQEAAALVPASNTLAMADQNYPEGYAGDATKSKSLRNPVAMTRKGLERGQDLYATYCTPCHGEAGLGNGMVVADGKFPKPPSLTSRKLRAAQDGELYHIITNGQNMMPHYRSQLRPVERWAVVNYVRALQRADFPKEKDHKGLPGWEKRQADLKTKAEAAAATKAAPAKPSKP